MTKKPSAASKARKPTPRPARKPAPPPPRRHARPSASRAPGRGAAQGRPPRAAAAEAARPARKPKCPFGKKELHDFREALLGMRSARIGDKESREKEALKAAGQDVSVDHMADFGSDNYEQEFTLGLLEQDIETLRDIHDALIRIREGTFGLCEECLEPVAKARLKAIPYARLCVDCKMKEE
ncbi:MAG: TraR/DksA family transcriptional regulator [Planctomycetes bacterium]|nr:TraR/DksA family transcriptional regulator [Planctomycetota bacterium]